MRAGTKPKKETELEFTRRLAAENPRGIKGLAYVLLEIRRAIQAGILKPKQSATKSKGIDKFRNMFNQAASTKLKQNEKVTELSRTLKAESRRILDHLLKDQNFSS